MTSFPDKHYAHCPFCGEHFGMALSSDGRGRGFVQCYCGARGPSVERKDFIQEGVFDLSNFDAATRRAWNMRGCSDGRAELQAQLDGLAVRMKMHTELGRQPPSGMFEEKDMWEGYLANLGDKPTDPAN
ncbi:hypothetical protein EGJ28_16350 [Stutzerimonas xanthomarina]|jgi:hypothetical protein|uniref:Uncharacterized protein n=1 Tax=Stutzerimonas xanthomarina TaxID=271420 RepID=A0A3R8U773_9GAMM|nr:MULTISPECIES: hypothetical protein [Stutzerimonas]KIL03164.1 hypothetical protein QX25_18430 [Stutzerimonas stutzeri]MBK3919978.1 hypothetical protein [Stutzerimonas frequens]RRV08836.1 hypothetical protein EGJ28_16350 [Stutzerimonas xanthomarina]